MSKGREPTRLISPLNTFHNSGNSSRLLVRKKQPKGVSRCASGSKAPPASRASVMVRNLTMRNVLPSKPGRTWVNNIGLPSFCRTSQASWAKGKAKSKRPKIENNKLNTRFTLCPFLSTSLNLPGSHHTFLRLSAALSGPCGRLGLDP